MANSNIQFSQICQIAAKCGRRQFNVRMLPTRGIEAHQFSKHGFKISEQQLKHYGQQVHDVRTQEEGLRGFLEFLREMSGETRTIVLAAHNIFGLHYPNIIARLMRKFGLMEDLKSLVLGFLDTYSVIQSTVNKRGLVNDILGNSFTLNALAEPIKMDIPEQPHAVENVGLLQRLIDTYNVTNELLLAPITDFDDHIRYIDLRYDLDDVVKTEKLQLIARAGISIQTLKDEYEANGNVTNLLTFLHGNQYLTEHEIQYINSRLADIIGGNW